MAITIPTEYGKWQGRSGEIDNIIVELTSSGTKWTVGDFESGNAWVGDHVYNLLTTHPTVKQKIDPINHDPSRATVNVTLSNAPQYNGNVRIVDEIGNIVAHGAAIYHMNSPNATSTDDCLLLFSGSTQSIDGYNESTVKIVLEDKGYVLDKEALHHVIDDFFPPGWNGVKESTKYKKAPLLYGDFSKDVNGLARIVKATDENHRYICCAHGTASSPRGLYIPVGQNLPAARISDQYFFTFNRHNDPADVDGTGHRAQMWAWPLKDEARNVFLASHIFTLDADNDAPFNTATYQHAGLGSIATRLPYVNGVSDIPAYFQVQKRYGEFYGSYTYSSVLVTEINNANTLQRLMENSSIPGNLYVNYEDFHMTPNLTFLYTVSIPDEPITEALSRQFMTKRAFIYNNWNQDTGALGSIYNKVLDTGWQLHGSGGDPLSEKRRELMGTTSTGSGETNRKWAFGMSVVGTRIDNDPVLTTDDTLAHIGYAYLDLEYELEDVAAASSGAGGLYDDYAYVDTQGRRYNEYGTPHSPWINNFYNHGTLNLTSNSHVKWGYMIDEAAGIIASILIDESNVHPDHIDWDGFVDSVTYAIRCRYNVIDEDLTVGDVIKDLCDQGMFTFAWTASGKMKLIPLRGFVGTTRTIASTIHYDDIDKDGLKVRKTDLDEVVNHITVKSRWFEDEQEFKETNVYENTTSQAEYGVRKRVLEFKNINTGDEQAIVSNPVKALMCHLIEPDKVNGEDDVNHAVNDGFWAKQRIEIEFTATGSKHKHLDVGDWIRLDDTSFDPHIKMFGESWFEKDFIVKSVNKSPKGNKIIAEKPSDYHTIWEIRGLGILSP